MKQMKKKILVVEDNLLLSGILRKWLKQADYEVLTAGDEPTARKLICKCSPDLILSDIRLPVGDGIRLLQWAAGENFLHIPFVVMTEFASYPDAVRAIKLGAVDYLHKPVYREPLLELLHEILKSPVTSRRNSPRLQRNSRRIREVERIARKVAPSDMSVLILGPNGSGKESVAQTIYEYSLRKDKPFVAVNCGGIPKELGASEFFGYVKGAFTGADADTPGYFEAARGGTLFLDEIGTMSHELQTSLLRVLQERVYNPVGSRRMHEADVRVIAATNVDMQRAVDEGNFREDLYHSLAEFEIRQPSLAECPEDILPLANFFLNRSCGELKRGFFKFTGEAEAALLSYHWPGNVRELSNRVRRAALLAEDTLVSCEDLGLDEAYFCNGMFNRTTAGLKDKAEERKRIVMALQTTGGNITRAAKLLGVSRRTLYNRMFKYGLK